MNRANAILRQFAPQAQLVVNNTAQSSFPKKPINVVVTGAAGNIAYAIIFMICKGEMLGFETPINLRLLDIEPMAGKMKGVLMEIDDCAFPLINSVITTTDYAVAFADCDIAMLIGARPRGPGMVRADLLKANAGIFKGQGQALDKYAKKDVKILVVGNPANTNALICMKNAPSIPRSQFTAMTKLDENRAIIQIANKLGVPQSKISGVGVFGNHSITQYPSVRNAFITDYPNPGDRTPVREALNDDAWLEGDFLKSNQQRGAAIIKARGGSSAASAAKSAVDHMREWVLGTPAGQVSSMGVCSDGNPYGVPDDLIYSFPCVCENGEWKIVGGLKIDDYSRACIDKSAKELGDEKAMALA